VLPPGEKGGRGLADRAAGIAAVRAPCVRAGVEALSPDDCLEHTRPRRDKLNKNVAGGKATHPVGIVTAAGNWDYPEVPSPVLVEVVLKHIAANIAVNITVSIAVKHRG
jgi:hypothetical protein